MRRTADLDSSCSKGRTVVNNMLLRSLHGTVRDAASVATMVCMLYHSTQNMHSLIHDKAHKKTKHQSETGTPGSRCRTQIVIRSCTARQGTAKHCVLMQHRNRGSQAIKLKKRLQTTC
jgi:hypothetical protein